MFSISPLVNWDSAVPSDKAVLSSVCALPGAGRAQAACLDVTMPAFQRDIAAKDSNSKNAIVYLSLDLTMNSTSNDKNKTKVVFVLV